MCVDDSCKGDGAAVRQAHSAYENQHGPEVLFALAKDKNLFDCWNRQDVHGYRKFVWMSAFMETVFCGASDMGTV